MNRAVLGRLAWRARPPALALGGGGARGFAHLGVLEGLERWGLAPFGIAGTSMGAVIGGMYLALGSTAEVAARWREARDRGLTPTVRPIGNAAEAAASEHVLLQAARRFRDRVVISLAVNRATMLDGDRLDRALEFLVPDVSIESLPSPFVAVATDLATGEEVRLSSGPLRSALRASSSIPGLFPELTVDGRRLVDGAVVAEVPVAAAASFGRRVVAVDVAMDLPPLTANGLVLDTMMRTQMMTGRLLVGCQLRGAARVLHPRVGIATWSDWDLMDELLAAGRAAVAAWLGDPPPTPGEVEPPDDPTGVEPPDDPADQQVLTRD